MSDYIKREDGFYQPKDYEGCRNCKYQPEPLRMCEYGENRDFLEIVCSKWEKKMTDYIKTKEYKFPDGETMTAYFDEYGIAKITIQALDAIFDKFINSADRVEVVRCKDCKHFDKYIDCKEMYQWDGFCDDWARKTYENWYCSRAERRNDGGE